MDATSLLTNTGERTAHIKWLVVSGGDQDELRFVFDQRGLSELFDGGIFGSPDDKEHILKRELQRGNIQQTAIFIGDTKYDYQAATEYNLDFIFVSCWSEFNGWQKYFQHKRIYVVESINQLID